MKGIIIFVFLIKFAWAKKYLVELEDKARNKEADEADYEEVEEAEDSHSDYSLKTEQLGLFI